MFRCDIVYTFGYLNILHFLLACGQCSTVVLAAGLSVVGLRSILVSEPHVFCQTTVYKASNH